MIAQELEVSIHMAFVEARQEQYEYITVEHLLLALLDNPSASVALQACDASIPELRTQLSNFVSTNVTKMRATNDNVDTQPTLGFQRVIQRAIMHVQATGSNRREVRGLDALIAVYGEKDSHAVYYLHQQNITRLDLVNFDSHGTKKISQSTTDGNQTTGHGKAQPQQGQNEKLRPLEQFTQNLNALAKADKIDPLIGREYEIERVIQTLCRRQKSNPLLVGEAGVGKTAIAEGLAWRIVTGEVPEVLRHAEVYSLDMGILLAGTKYRGDFEQRVKGILKSIKEHPNAILFIDEIHTIIGVGAASGGALDASNLLKPALSSGQLRCIGATTFSEWRGIFEKQAALARRFQKIEVIEPSIQETIAILEGLKLRFEAHHSITYAQSALQAAAELSAKFITGKHLPDKAIDLIDEAGAAQRILPSEERKETITSSEVEKIVAKIARVPTVTVSKDDRSKLQTLERDLKNVVFGQDEALEALTVAVKVARSGLGKTDKPIGSFLFSGPTGVGKTEAAKQLAYILGVDLLRFDMSEYMERHSVSRLIGAPPGYVGFDQGGLLTETVTQKPHSVLLLDEIEKAHPDIFNVLLQIMDNGFLTDSNGRKTDFRNVIIIMTTNAGAEAINKASIGFTNQHQTGGDEMIEIKRIFTPEFRNRLDAIISFKPLDIQVITKVVDKFLLQLESQLTEKKVEVSFSNKLRHYLAKKGFDPLMGARPMQRLIQDTIRKALADELLFGRLLHGGRLCVDIDKKEKVKLHITPLTTNTRVTQTVDV
jgi:ATP-dependent Clp protease ATP-binding subunit ClpA